MATAVITLDNLTAENVGGLTNVELIDLVYEQLTRVQRLSGSRFYPDDEPLLETYDEHVPNTRRNNNPRMVALSNELLKRFEPLRNRLTAKQKSCLTRTINELDFFSLVAFTKDHHGKPVNDMGMGKSVYNTLTLSNTVLALLLEGESQEAWSAVLQKYAVIHQRWEEVHKAWIAKTYGKPATAAGA